MTSAALVQIESFRRGMNVLFLLMFLMFSGLTNEERRTLTEYFEIRNVSLSQYNWQMVRTVFMTLLSNPRTSIANPSLRNRNHDNQNRTFTILEDYGELDGNFGYWVEDYETELEGFLDATEDEFWFFNEEESCWKVKHFKGRTYRKGRPKGRGKGRKGRKRFRALRRGKEPGKNRSYETDWYDDPSSSREWDP